ncbi:MAG: response regulator [Nitrospinae bacterium]|nr:response regulator [Nitrospinota bacterium]
MEKKILIVDDEPEILGLMSKVLGDEGYRVSVARDGEEALVKFHVDPVQLVITDMVVPKVDGILLLKQIKNLYPATMALLVTAHGRMDSAIEAMKAGAENVLAKPVDMDHLVIEVAKCFDNLRLRQENESLSGLIEMRNKFITLTDHEFRTPLSIITGCIAILKGDAAHCPLSPKAQTTVDMMEEASNRLLDIIERFHDMEILSQAWLKPSPSTFNIGEKAWDIITIVSAAAHERCMNFDLKNTMARHDIQQDKNRVGHILMELIQNAVKYTRDRGTISVWLGEADSDERRKVIVKISDTGVGMPPNQLKHALEPFYEGKDVMEHSSSNWGFNGGGIGVGLTRVKMLLESIRGQMFVASAEGKGTTFTLSIPAVLDLKKENDDDPKLTMPRKDLPDTEGS